jgi:hypothetical protein
VQVASVRALQLSAKDLSRFAVVTTTCEEGVESSEQRDLYDRFGVVDYASVTVFLVQLLKDPVNPPLLPSPDTFDGCAAHGPGRPAVFLDAFTDGYVLAHELTHVLLEHAPYRLQEHSARSAQCARGGRTRDHDREGSSFLHPTVGVHST